jgi:hypothetical protein
MTLVATADPVPPSVLSTACVPAPPAIDSSTYPPEICSMIFKFVFVFVPQVPAFSYIVYLVLSQT